MSCNTIESSKSLPLSKDVPRTTWDSLSYTSHTAGQTRTDCTVVGPGGRLWRAQHTPPPSLRIRRLHRRHRGSFPPAPSASSPSSSPFVRRSLEWGTEQSNESRARTRARPAPVHSTSSARPVVMGSQRGAARDPPTVEPVALPCSSMRLGTHWSIRMTGCVKSSHWE